MPSTRKVPMSLGKGAFVISLDFELFWGVRDKRSLAQYGENVRGVHKAIPRLLEMFSRYDIHATFATVGFLFCTSKSDLLAQLPDSLPDYTDPRFSPYGSYLDGIGRDEDSDPYHFGNTLLDSIQEHPQHEIATHTFSHFYPLEAGPSLSQFRADLIAAKRVATRRGITLESIVFPRNQVSPTHLKICHEEGIRFYRGTEQSWLYEGRATYSDTLFRRGLRLTDSYIPLTGYHTYEHAPSFCEGLLNIPASRFLRPVASKLSMLEPLRQKRIMDAMTFAARYGRMYHLWWHPHNFGIRQDANFKFLEALLRHYRELHVKQGFTSLSMREYGYQVASVIPPTQTFSAEAV